MLRGASLACALVALACVPVAAERLKHSNAPAERAAIDGVCDVFDARPALVRHVRLARVRENGKTTAWKVVDDAALAKLANGGSLDADLADVYTRDGKIVYATYTRSGADAGGAREYCYINAKLARASTELVDASSDHSITRKLYYDARGLFADTGATVLDITKRHDATVPVSSNTPLDVPVYAVPRALPFYDAYRASLAGK
ncbi:MAG: hypothetical protein IAI48_17690 [Candidatus Eremiobacteraeota bacterium]|nr:hypothetical protein [Candidatus Eremiobacteraeota bacterium]